MKRVIACVVLLVAAPVFGDDLTLGITGVTAILDGNGAARVLFKAGALPDLGSIAIRRANVTLPTGGPLADRTVNLRVHPVTTPWTPGAVDWFTGWTRPGGDFDDELYSRVEWDLRGGSSELSLDVTLLLKEILEEGMTADGFILTVDPAEGLGIDVQDLSRVDGLASASLEVRYRRVPPRRAQVNAAARLQPVSGASD